jgi:hypothetical protein
MNNGINFAEKPNFGKELSFALNNEKALALVKATLRNDLKPVIAKTTLAYDAVELIRTHWNQSSLTHRQFLNNTLEGMRLEERKDSVLFLIECETIRDQLHACNDKPLTDCGLAEKVLTKLPKRSKIKVGSVIIAVKLTELADDAVNS